MGRVKLAAFMALTALMALLLALGAVINPTATRRAAIAVLDDVRPDGWLYQLIGAR
jgi:hypothetical protein